MVKMRGGGGGGGPIFSRGDHLFQLQKGGNNLYIFQNHSFGPWRDVLGRGGGGGGGPILT